MEPYELRNIIIRQTAALESAVKVMIADRQSLFEASCDSTGQILDDLDRIEIVRMDGIIEQCQAAIVSGRAVQEQTA